MVKDFRNLLQWRNYVRSLRREGDAKQIITNFEATSDYIAKLEGQIVELSIKVDQLEKELKNVK